MKSYAVLAVALGVLAGAGACSRSEPPGAAGQAGTAAARPKSYPLTGEILSIDAARKILVVKHNNIPGYMPAMTMEFAVSAADLAAAKPGQHIRADLIRLVIISAILLVILVVTLMIMR